jgi:hypothetical protein
MKVEQVRPNVFALTATSQEISALVAAARMAAELMEQDPRAPAEALELVRGVLRDWDAAIEPSEPAG